MQTFTFLSDVLLLLATAGMALWCSVLTRRLKAFDALGPTDTTALDALSSRVDALAAAVPRASVENAERAQAVELANARADDRIGRMEMLLASLEDLENEQSDRLLDVPGEPPADILPSFRAARPPMSQEVRR